MIMVVIILSKVITITRENLTNTCQRSRYKAGHVGHFAWDLMILIALRALPQLSETNCRNKTNVIKMLDGNGYCKIIAFVIWICRMITDGYYFVLKKKKDY